MYKVCFASNKKPQKLPEITVSGISLTLYTTSSTPAYFGARYLDPRTSRWLSVDPAMYQGDYIPGAPINDEVRRNNNNLPGMGGIYNYVNMHVYHYGGNNPVKYVDPDGKDIKAADNQSERFYNDYEIAMTYLMGSATANFIINHVNINTNVTVHSTQSLSSYSSFNSIIYWAHRYGFFTADGGVISSALVLMHEIIHVFVDTEYGTEIFNNFVNTLMEIYPYLNDSNFDFLEEFVTFYESHIGKELGVGATRAHYNDVARSNSGFPIMLTVPDPIYNRAAPPGINFDE